MKRGYIMPTSCLELLQNTPFPLKNTLAKKDPLSYLGGCKCAYRNATVLTAGLNFDKVIILGHNLEACSQANNFSWVAANYTFCLMLDLLCVLARDEIWDLLQRGSGA